MGIQQKFVATVLLGLSVFVLVFLLSLYEQRQAVLEAYTARNRSVVSVTASLLQQIENRRLAGEYDMATARSKGREVIEHLRYDGGEYLFVIDLNGKMVVNPARPDMVGADMLTFRDDNGQALATFITRALEQGEGAAHYSVSRITGGRSLEKISYARMFAPWGWLVGTGTYVEDAEAMFLASAERFAALAVPSGVLILAVIFWLAKSVATPIRHLSQAVDAISGHQPPADIPHTGRSDELGHLARAVESLRRVSVMEEEVRKIQHLIVSVFDASQEAALICDAEGKIEFASPALCRLSGYAAADLVGRPLSLLYSGLQDEDVLASIDAQLERSDFWEGDIWNRRADGEVFVVRQRRLLVRDASHRVVNLVAVMTDAVERQPRGKGAHFLPQHDPLTNLADRALLSERLERALALGRRQGRPLALLVVDLDQFRQVNHRAGMVGGDEALRFLALRLMKAVRSADTVARLSGDEFAVLMEEFAGPPEVQSVAERILDGLRQPLAVAGTEVVVTASVGIVLAPQDGRGQDRLLRGGRRALAEAKAHGGDCAVWATPAAQVQALAG